MTKRLKATCSNDVIRINSDKVSFKMVAATLTMGRTVGIVVIVLFVFGFAINWFYQWAGGMIIISVRNMK